MKTFPNFKISKNQAILFALIGLFMLLLLLSFDLGEHYGKTMAK